MFFGGKGGVGKTTCAAARAVREALRGARVLVVSTDPAHSLGDALGVRLSSRPRLIALDHRSTTAGHAGTLLAGRRVTPGRSKRTVVARETGSLHASELDAPRALARWVADHRHALGDVIEHGTWLDRDDLDALLDLPVPGVDELVGIVEIMRMASSGAYDAVIVDTAPTGHTLRLLAAPDTVASVAGVLDALQAEHRIIRERFAGRRRPEAADRVIALIAGDASDAGARLRDSERTVFEWVMLAEPLSLAESADGVAALERARIRVGDIIINRVIPDGAPCPMCDRRRAGERRVIARIPRTLGRARRLRVVAAQLREPRGLAALIALGTPSAGVKRSRLVRQPSSVAFSAPARAQTTAPEDLAALSGASLLFFAGKGGAGKTTAAAAAAVRLAHADPSRDVLLLSIDPAHSLGDVFGAAVGDRPAPIPGGAPNLYVRELDAAAALAARRSELEKAIAEIVASSDRAMPGSGRTAQAVERLMDFAPPGIDELFGMLTVVEAQREYPLIVVDAAPTGHALRLLEMPDAAHDWVQVLLRVLLKYRSLARPQHLAAALVDLSKSVRQLRDRLHDRAATRFIVVTRAADLPMQETTRFLGRLRRLQLAVPAVIVNALTMAPGACRRCRAAHAEEVVECAALRARCGRTGCAIIQTPLAAPPPRGVTALDRWARTWIEHS